jgi:cytochrome c-type biogenesis protein CcmF
VSAMRRILLVPVLVACGALVLLLALTDASQSIPSLLMFTFVAFVLSVVGQEFVRGASARRVMTGESWPRALARLTGRNRRRYGGFLVHAGIAVLFLGVAASSAFLQQRDVRLSPGDTVKVGDYKITYDRPTARLGGDVGGTGAPISLGAVMRVSRGGETYTLHPSRNYYATADPSKGPISRFFEGDANSEVAIRWGLRRDFWLAVRPDLTSFNEAIARADTKFADSPPQVQAIVIRTLTELYRQKAPPALVTWIWIGGAIAVFGALLAAWPSPEARLRRVRSLYAARLGRELSRA